jgi:putative MATE family efflux protein
MKKIDFEHGGIAENILMAAFPMLIAQVLSLLYSIVDRIYIGRIPGAGTAALGAVGLCFPIIMIISGFTNLYGMGAPLYSMELGRGNLEKARQYQNTSFRFLVITAVVITLACELFGRKLLALFGATAAEIPDAHAYLQIYAAGTIFFMISSGLNPFLNAQGYASAGMLSVTIGALTNLALDPVFIFVLGLGIRGAAAATVLSQFLSFAFVMRFYLDKRGKHAHSDDPLTFAFRFPGAKDILGLGISSFVMQATNSLVQITCNRMLMQFGGAMYISVMTIVSSVRSILDVPAQAVTEGASPTISYNYGARRAGNVRKAMKLTIALAVSYTAAAWLVVLFFPEFFVRIFSNDPKLLEPGARALHLYFFAFLFQALQYSGQTFFKALGKKKQTIFFSLLRKAVLVVPLTLILPTVFGLGTDGVFMAEPISNVIGGTACFVTMLCTVLPELSRMEEDKESA